MKQQFIDTLNSQLDLRAKFDHHIDVLKACNSAINKQNAVLFMGGDPYVRKAELERVIFSNMAILEESVREKEVIYSSYLIKINKQREFLNRITKTVLKLDMDIKDAQNKSLELKTKIEEIDSQKSLLIREQVAISESKITLINGMNPKQISFVLQKAILEDKIDVVKLLIDKDFDINFQNNNQETLLHITLKLLDSNSIWNDRDVFNKLINHPNVDVNITDKEGNTALSICLERNDTSANDLIPILLNKGSSAELVIIKAIKDQDLSLLNEITKLVPALVENKDTTDKTLTEIEFYILENFIKQSKLKVVEDIFKMHPSMLDQEIESRSMIDFALQYSSQEMNILIYDLTESYHASLIGQNQ